MNGVEGAAIGEVIGEGVSVQHERGAAESTDGDEPWCRVFVEGAVVGDGYRRSEISSEGDGECCAG